MLKLLADLLTCHVDQVVDGLQEQNMLKNLQPFENLTLKRISHILATIFDLILSQEMQSTHNLDVPAWQVLLDAVVDEASHEDLARGLRKPAEISTFVIDFFSKVV